MGGDPDNAKAPVGYLATGKKEVDEAGLDFVRGKRPKAEVQAMLEKAGYKGERLVLLHATEHTFFNPAAQVVAQQLRDVGMNIDDQAMDWATVQTRRTNRLPLDQGGWSLFTSVTPVPE
jgi:peptide/nickel transport system substrate-binding protein